MWRTENPDVPGAGTPLAEAFILARRLFGDLLERTVSPQAEGRPINHRSARVAQ
jgi:hypothetical protein